MRWESTRINAPVTKRNRSTRYGCQRARGLRPSCHPRSRAASFVVYSDLRAAGVRSRAASFVVCDELRAADARSRTASCVVCGELRAADARSRTASFVVYSASRATDPRSRTASFVVSATSSTPHPPLTPTRSPNSNSVQLLPRESSRFPRRRARCAVVLLLAVRARRVRRRPC